MCKEEKWIGDNEFRALFAVRYFGDKRFEVFENVTLKHNSEFKKQDYIKVKIPSSLVKSITLAPKNDNFPKDAYADFNVTNPR